MPGVYRIEVSPNKRAGCQSTECKKTATKIQAGELRFGTFVTIQEHQGWRWKHWGCVTPQQILNLKESVEDDLQAYLDGYEELGDDDKAKIAAAVEAGHVADEDWKWDVEMNRPGQKGFRTPASKKKAREKAKAEKEAAEDGNDSPSTPPGPKKRSRVKKDADANDKEDAHVEKKQKRGRPKKEADVNDDDSVHVELKPKRGRMKKEVVVEEEEEEAEKEVKPAPKQVRNAPKRGKKIKVEDDSDGEAPAKPARQKAVKPEREPEPGQAIKAEDEVDKRSEDGGLNVETKEEGQATDPEDEDDGVRAEATKNTETKKSGKPAIRKGQRGSKARSQPAAEPKSKKAPESKVTEKVKRTSGRNTRS